MIGAGSDGHADRTSTRGGAASLVLAVCVLASLAAAVSRAGADESADQTVARMDELWARRDANDAMQKLVAAGTQGFEANPGNYEIEWRVARAYFWVAYTQPSRVVKKAMAGKAIEWADRARTHQPDRVEGHYLYAIATGEYANTISDVQAAMEGIAGKVESAALRAYEIDRDYNYGAPGTVLGRYYFMLPWPLRSLERSRRYLEEVVTRHPEVLIARAYLAETYYELGRHNQAREQLAFVLANERPPGTELDLPSPKVLAEESMQRWFPDQPGASGQGGQ